jgi:mannose-6-phosphate isomerase
VTAAATTSAYWYLASKRIRPPTPGLGGRPLPLLCGVQDYAWGERGATSYIARLRGVTPEASRCYAEMWIGDHPGLPAFAKLDGGGDDVAPLAEATGARLPFLMKVLAAADCLSIQVHPDEQQARQGYEDEQRRGIPASDPARNFKDASHKPELIVALTPFWSLKGFRPLAEIAAALDHEAPELRPLMPDIAARAARAGDDAAARAAVVRELYETAMRLPQQERNGLLAPLVERLGRQHAATPFPDSRREHWVLETDRRYVRGDDRDRGLFSLYLLNFVTLAPGQALFLGAGELHSYLRGVGVEVMANSDNVIRGGLTPKHVDVEALLAIVKFTDGAARVLEADADGVYQTPAGEFEVARLRIAGGAQARRPGARGVDIWLATTGRAEVVWSGGTVAVDAGVPVLVPAAAGGYEVRAVSDAELFRASARGFAPGPRATKYRAE